ncbi:MAG: PLDc N-terminal domain-containing protein [Gammaproteobacteria bacterium]|nr:PLDc N-terminal domain-containing protein [Gammaproteobacteria bacterium]
MMTKTGGLLGFIHLVLVVWAVINIVQSRNSNGSKVLWTVLVIMVPVVGILLWLLFGPRGRAG